ncbi:asparagine synthase-related protein, partial [bacterium]|nr:asparagine synthase-related protein [bacterium]
MKEIAFKKIAFGNNLNTQFSQWYPLDTFLYHKLKTKLFESVQRNKAKGLLFSGGLDSAVLAAISPGIKAITVSLINQATTDSDVVARFIGHKNEGEDVQYAISAARLLNIEHFHRQVGIEEALEAVPQVIKILKTFDPAIPNDLVVYFGLKQARELGIDEIMTGDGADELFGGYAFMQKIDDLEGYIRKITPRMRFSSNKIGEFFKIRTVQPFLDKKFIYFSLKISP